MPLGKTLGKTLARSSDVRGSESKARVAGRCRWLATAALLLAAAGDAGGEGRAAAHRAPAVIEVDHLHDAAITGRGVTVAVVDGGEGLGREILQAADGHARLLAAFDALAGTVVEAPASRPAGAEAREPSTALEILLSSAVDAGGRYEGIAPNADLVLVTDLDSIGAAGTVDIARGIEWAVANRERYGIRVLVLPLAVPPRSLGADPVGRMVMKAWASGIVVVAAAGDLGAGAASVSAATAAGVAALAFEHSPWLTPDEVKPRLENADGSRVWSAGNLRGFVWSDLAARGFVWSDFSDRGFVWSDFSAGALTWSDLEARGFTWSDDAGRGFLWSD